MIARGRCWLTIPRHWGHVSWMVRREKAGGVACLSPNPWATMTVEVCRLSAGTTSAAAELATLMVSI